MTDEYKQEFWDLLHVWADAASEESIEHAEHRIDELLTLMASAMCASTQAQLEGMARALEDVAWRIGDIRDKLLRERRYGIDELSPPALDLLRAHVVAVRAAKNFAGAGP